MKKDEKMVDEFRDDLGLKRARKEVEAEKQKLVEPPVKPTVEPVVPEPPKEEPPPAEPVVEDPPPAEPDPIEPPPDEPPLEEDEELTKGAKRIEELTKKLNDRDGEHGTAIAELRQKNLLMQAEMERMKAARPTPVSESEPDLSEQAKEMVSKLPQRIRDKYDSDEELLDFMELQLAMEGNRKRSDVSAQPESVQEIKDRIDRMEDRRWYDSIEALVPGFTVANGDGVSVPGDKAWGEYLAEPVYSGAKLTRAEALNGASAEAVAEQFKAYSSGTGVKVPSPARPTVEQQVSPKTKGSATKQVQGKQTMTQAQFDAFAKQAAQPGSSEEDRKKWKNAVQANQEGRVVG